MLSIFYIYNLNIYYIHMIYNMFYYILYSSTYYIYFLDIFSIYIMFVYIYIIMQYNLLFAIINLKLSFCKIPTKIETILLNLILPKYLKDWVYQRKLAKSNIFKIFSRKFSPPKINVLATILYIYHYFVIIIDIVDIFLF